ncbi:acyl carrier protein [Saccharopolyspora rosea]|uniref:Acyl carrier protein n=1 Tax=Saccharopolyspora rosea TaxID=524884 RepID=A0ABW3FR69_9PSEU|nr:acyl carrier protein [Saccharopolyspora rosea]
MQLTLDELRRILAECSGAEAEEHPGSDVLDTAFDDLGYDSLALIETGARIKQEYGITIPEDELTELRTPRDMLDIVNHALVEKA